MLTELLTSERLPPEQKAVVVGDRVLTWGDLRDSVATFVQSYKRFGGRRVGLRFSSAAFSYVLLFVFETLNVDLFLLDTRLPPDEAARFAHDLQLAALLSPTDDNSTSGVTVEEFSCEGSANRAATVTILTSGTTGKPKLACHTWRSLGRPVRRDENKTPPKWLQAYRPNLYAGLQVCLQCFANYGTLYVPQDDWGPSEIAKFVAENEIEYISATPSYWRWLLLFSNPSILEAWNPTQITLGGEVVDQSILDALQNRFPRARIVHIYATTELGRCFSVTDGLQGFPRRFLAGPSPDGIEMCIQESELLVRSSNAMGGYYLKSLDTQSGPSWFATGDLVTAVGHRVLFTGRKSDIINVGGNKVHPLEVERVIRSVPGVSEIRVFARPSSVFGQLVACDIVSDKSRNDAELEDAVRRICKSKLSAHQSPRIIKIVERIKLSPAQKIIRSEND